MQVNQNTTRVSAPSSERMDRNSNNFSILRSTVGGTACGAIGVAVIAMPTAGNCLNGTVTPGMLGKAVAYGAAGGAISGAGGGLVALAAGSVGACLAGSLTACTGANTDTVAVASGVGCGIGATLTGVALLPATGYIAKTLAPSAFTGSAINTGLKVVGGECVAAGLGIAGTLGCATLALGPTVVVAGINSAVNRQTPDSAPTNEMIQR
jgi:hypothetical protein